MSLYSKINTKIFNIQNTLAINIDTPYIRYGLFNKMY